MELMDATILGNIQKVQELIDAGKHPDEDKNADGSTALIRAAQYGDLELTKILVRHGAQVQYENKCGSTAFIWAARNGHLGIAELLLRHGARIHHENKYGNTALMWAAEYKRLEVADFLVKNGAPVQHEAEYGFTALLYSAMNGDLGVTDLLIRNGARTGHRDEEGKTALDWAKENKHSKVVALLEQKENEERLQTLSLQSARQWCRIFASDRHAELFRSKATGELEMLLNFFITYPGLRRLVGGTLVLFYNPWTTDDLITLNCCAAM